MLDEPTDNQFQVITLTGRLTADPELRSTSNGLGRNLRLAIQRPRKDGEDQGADYVDITVFGRQADTCTNTSPKAARSPSRAACTTPSGTRDNGHRQKLEVIARNVEFLDAAQDATTPTRARGGRAAAA